MSKKVKYTYIVVSKNDGLISHLCDNVKQLQGVTKYSYKKALKIAKRKPLNIEALPKKHQANATKNVIHVDKNFWIERLKAC